MIGRLSLHHRMGEFSISLDTSLQPGLTAIFGASGAGKTTVLRMVAGLLRPASGIVEIEGARWLDTERGVNLPPEKRRVAYVFQEPRLFPHLSVLGNLRYGEGRARRNGREGQAARLVELLGLGPLLRRRTGGLSGGEAQRVALARALLSDPDILLMDEPLSALDRVRKEELLPYFERLKAGGGPPVLYVSHDIDEVARLADRMILLDGGRIAGEGPVAEVLAGAAPDNALARAIAGGLLTVRIADYHAEDGLTEVRLGPHPFWLPGHAGAPGETIRLRVEARDITLALNRPEGLSALNILPVEVGAIDAGPGSGALVRLVHDGQHLTARLTRRSVRDLALAPGQRVFAILKTMSVAPGRVTHEP